jgi:predicted O-methyltransferase YrrM
VTQERWTAVDRYLAGLLVPADPTLDAALAAAAEAGLPAAEVAPNQGKLLHLLARLAGATAILELGTLGGYSAIWLAQAVPEDGRLVTLESNPAYAEVARANLAAAGLEAIVDVRVGPAAASLAELVAEGAGPFDLVFVDADKAGNAEYLGWALRLTAPGSLIVADNVVRNGAVVEAASADASVRGVRRFLELVAAEPRLEATAIQTVSVKGHDGLALALVVSGPTPVG